MHTKQIHKSRDQNPYQLVLKNNKKRINVAVDFTPVKALSLDS